MNKELIFAFGENVIRVAGTPENPLFVANDICRALEINNPRQAVASFSESEKGVIQNDTLGGRQEMVAVTEAGLYRLIFRSDKPAARSFQDWVFREVLPSIRKNGQYAQESWLWEAYGRAKTGTVQLMVLRQLGVGERPPESRAVIKIEPDRIWNDIHAIAEIADGSDEFAGNFRISKVQGEQFAFEFYMAHNAVFERLRHVFPEVYREIRELDFRNSLTATSEWVAGDWTKRFKSGVMHAWLFKTADSNSAVWGAAFTIHELNKSP